MLSSQLPHISLIGAINALLCLNHSVPYLTAEKKGQRLRSRVPCTRAPVVYWAVPPMQQQDSIARGHDACYETNCQAVRKQCHY